jgi:hypothetical protein
MQSFINFATREGISTDIINELLNFGKVINIKSRAVLLDYNQSNNYIYYVLEGGFSVKYWSEMKDKEIAVSFYLDNYQPFVTEIRSYFLNQKSKGKIQAICNSKVLAFAKQDLEKLVATDHSFEKIYNQQILNILLSESEFRIKLLTYPPDEFYKLLIKEYPAILEKVSSKDIADFLNISDVWLSNLKRKL